MSNLHMRSEHIPVPVSSRDPESLRQLADVYDGMLQEDVLTVSGDVVPEMIERSQLLASRIEERIGAITSAETLKMGLLTIENSDRTILESARRIQPDRLI